MREQDAVFLALLPLSLILYGLISSVALPAIVPSVSVPGPVQRVAARTLGMGTVTRGQGLITYLVWTAITQVSPVLVALSAMPAFFRVASAIELGLAIAWTVYLVSRK